MASDIEMIEPKLCDLLCCPDTLQSLRAATTEEIESVSRDGVVNRAGKPILLPLDGGLVRADGSVLYPIWDGIPCLLIEDGIFLKAVSTKV